MERYRKIMKGRGLSPTARTRVASEGNTGVFGLGLVPKQLMALVALLVFMLSSVQQTYAQCGTVSSSYTTTGDVTCTSLNLTGGTYTIAAGTTVTVGTLNIASGGTLQVNGNLNVTDPGSSTPSGASFTAQNGSTFKTGTSAVITVGPSGNPSSNYVVQFSNGSQVNTLANGATFIVNGSLDNKNNSNNIKIDGSLIVNGNISAGSGSTMTTGGTGSVQVTGTTSGSGTIFGSATGSSSYPVSSSCTQTITNNPPSATSASVACGGTTTLSTGTISGGTGNITYVWEASTATSGWTAVRSLTTATTSDSYTPTVSQTTNYRVKVTRNSCTRISSIKAITATGTSTPAVSISTASTTVCSGVSVTFTATASNTGSGTVTYTFFKNNVEVQQGASNTYTTSSLANSDQITCNISISGGSCITTNTASSNSLTMTVNAAPTVNAVTSQTVCNGSNTSAITFSGSNVTSYTWTNDNTSIGLAANGTGNIAAFTATNSTSAAVVATVVVTANNATCAGPTTRSFTFTVNPTTTIVTQPVATSVCASSNATFTVAATGVGLTYQWKENGANLTNTGIYSGTTSATLTLTGATTTQNGKAYSVFVSGTCGSVLSNNPVLTVNTRPSTAVLAAGTGATTICNGSSANVKVTVTGGTSPYTVVYSGGTVSSYTSAANISVSPSSTTTYSLTSVTDANGCTATTPSGTATITVNQLPTVSGTTNGSRCGTGTVSIGATASTGATIDWYAASSGGSVLTSGTGVTTYTTPSITGTTIYYAQARNTTTGCVSSTRTAVTATINPVPTVIITNPASVCDPTTVDLTAAAVTSGSTSALTYTYWTDAAATASLSSPSAVKTSGTYYIKGTTAAGCAATVQSVTVTVNSTPTVAVSNPAPTICTGSSVSLTATGEPGNTISFTGANQYIQLNDDPLQTATDFTFEAWIYWTDNSTYWQRIFDFGNSTTVNMFFTPKSGSGFPRYAITTTGNGGEQQINTTTSFTTNAWNHVAITYNGATNTGIMYLNGTQIGSNTSMTIGPDNLTPKPLAFNYFGESQYVADPNFAGKLDEIRIWNVARSATEINTYKGSSVPTNSTGLVAYYKLNEGSGNTLVSVTGTSTATVSGSPTWTTSTASVSPAGGQTTSYTWTPSTALSATTGATVTANPTTTTTYTVTGTYAPNGCSASATATVTVLVPSVAIAASATSICPGTSVTFTATPTNGGTPTYQWKKNGTNISGATSATYSVTTLVDGDVITCQMTATGTCTSTVTSNSITMSVTSVSISASATTICSGSSVTFTTTTTNAGTPTYVWKKNGGTIGGATASTYSVSTLANNDVITCVMTPTGSCTTPQTSTGITMTVNARPSTAVLAAGTGATTICNGSSANVKVTVTGGLSPYSVVYSGGTVNSYVSAANISVSPSTTTTYTLTSVTDANGCTATTPSGTPTVTVNSRPSTAVLAAGTGATTICNGSSANVKVTVTGGLSPYSVVYSGGTVNSYVSAANISVSPSTTTTYTLTSVTDANGCTATTPSGTPTVTVNARPSTAVLSGTASICNGSSTNLAVAVTGGLSPYTVVYSGGTVNSYVSAANISVSPSTTTTYTLTSVTDANGCTATTPSGTPTITVNTTLTNNTIGSDESICYNTAPSAITSTATIGGGNGSYTYQWQSSINNSTFADVSGETSSGYSPASITVTTWYRRVASSGGCTSTSNTVQKSMITGSFTWVGNTSNSWSTAGNWCGNAVPTASDNVTINSGTANSPVIDGVTAYSNSFTMATGASLAMQNGAILQVAGNWTNNGTLIPYDGTTVKFTASSGTQTIGGAATQTFYNLEKNAAGTLTISGTSDVTIRRGGLLKISAGTFDMNSRTVLLKSKVAADGTDSTASLGVVTGTITNASNFKIERYNSAVRGIRYISAPVSGVTASAFKDSIIVAGPASGGFDAPNSSISTIKEYVESRNWSLSKCFVSFTSINTTITPGKGYYLFVPGKRTTVYPAAEAVTLLMKGAPVTGNVNFSLSYTPSASQDWNLVGNPYPSAIDWDAAAWTKTNLDDAMYMWDPNNGTSGAYYAYVFGISSDGRSNGSIIPSSQGFFVKANAASPALSVTENAKVSNTYGKANFRVAQTASYVTLKVSNQNGDVDYTTVRLDDASGRTLTALKMSNSKINMYTKDATGTNSYSINVVQDVPSFTVPIYIESTTSNVYNIEVIKVEGDINAANNLKILDQATGHYTDVVVGAKLTLVPDGNAQRISLIRVAAAEVVTNTVDEVEIDGGYELYPTHIHGHSHPVLYTYDQSEKKIEIYKSNGTKLAEHSTHHSHYSFDDFGKYDSGVYMVKVTSNSKTHNFKIVK